MKSSAIFWATTHINWSHRDKNLKRYIWKHCFGTKTPRLLIVKYEFRKHGHREHPARRLLSVSSALYERKRVIVLLLERSLTFGSIHPRPCRRLLWAVIFWGEFEFPMRPVNYKQPRRCYLAELFPEHCWVHFAAERRAQQDFYSFRLFHFFHFFHFYFCFIADLVLWPGFFFNSLFC